LVLSFDLGAVQRYLALPRKASIKHERHEIVIPTQKGSFRVRSCFSWLLVSQIPLGFDLPRVPPAFFIKLHIPAILLKQILNFIIYHFKIILFFNVCSL